MGVVLIEVTVLPVAVLGGCMRTIIARSREFPVGALIEIRSSSIGETSCRCARQWTGGCHTIIGHEEEWQLELIREATTCICDHISVIAPGLSNTVVHKDMNALPGLPACPSK